MGVTAAQQRLIAGSGSLNLVDYVESLRAVMESNAGNFSQNRRDYQATVRVHGQCGVIIMHVITEGLN